MNYSDFTTKYRRFSDSNDLPTEGRANGETTGLGALRKIGKYALLRSVVIKENFRENGYGQQLVEYVLKQAHESGVQKVHLLTTTAADFFDNIGFTRVSREQLPESIRRSERVIVKCCGLAHPPAVNHAANSSWV